MRMLSTEKAYYSYSDKNLPSSFQRIYCHFLSFFTTPYSDFEYIVDISGTHRALLTLLQMSVILEIQHQASHFSIYFTWYKTIYSTDFYAISVSIYEKTATLLALGLWTWQTPLELTGCDLSVQWLALLQSQSSFYSAILSSFHFINGINEYWSTM